MRVAKMIREKKMQNELANLGELILLVHEKDCERKQARKLWGQIMKTHECERYERESNNCRGRRIVTGKQD